MKIIEDVKMYPLNNYLHSLKTAHNLKQEEMRILNREVALLTKLIMDMETAMDTFVKENNKGEGKCKA